MALYVVTGYWVDGYAEGEGGVTPALVVQAPTGGYQLPHVGRRRRRDEDVPLEPQSFHEPQEPRDVPLLGLPAYRPVPARSNFRELLAKLEADRIEARRRFLDDDDEDVILLLL
jgi:hypothetical protein